MRARAPSLAPRPAPRLGAVLAALALTALAAAPACAQAQAPAFPEFENADGAFARSKEPEACLSCHGAEAAHIKALADVEETCDVVVVGAGLAGLMAAHDLRERSVIVLEKEGRAGGKAKRNVWEGIAHSEGPAYIVEPDGDVKRLLDELKLRPDPVPEPANSLAVDGKVIHNPWTTGVKDLPFPEAARKTMKAAFDEIAALSKDLAVPASKSSERLRELDKVPALEFFAQYGPEMTAFMEPYIRSCFGYAAEEVSALGALIFFVDEFQPVFSFPGGLGFAAEKLAASIDPKRIRLRSYVTEVTMTEGGVRVLYRDANGKGHGIRAKAVVMAISQAAAKFLVKGLSDERKELMGRVFHGAYAVAAIKTKKPVLDGSFDTWFLAPRGGGELKVTDVIVADWVARGGKPGAPDRKHVLTAYWPLGSTGRTDLLSKPLAKIRDEMVEDLAARIPGLKESIIDVEVYCHGHGQHVALPGYLTEIAPKLAEPVDGKVFWAGVELDLPCFESAVWSGAEAARQVKAQLQKGAGAGAGK